MDQKKIHRWLDINDIDIPAIPRPGFTSDVLEREIWQPAAQPETLAPRTEVQQPTQERTAYQPAITLTRINAPGQEVICVRGDIFTIGKSRKADYTVQGNSAISRIHAMIYRSGDAYYLEDQGSLNHTYVDEELITGPYQLRNGLVIRFANEDFILKME